jgi:hypothetical protein
MKVLVAWAPRHGSIREVAGAVAETLEPDGLRTELVPAGEVQALDSHGGVVLGSALSVGRPQKGGADVPAPPGRGAADGRAHRRAGVGAGERPEIRALTCRSSPRGAVLARLTARRRLARLRRDVASRAYGATHPCASAVCFAPSAGFSAWPASQAAFFAWP